MCAGNQSRHVAEYSHMLCTDQLLVSSFLIQWCVKNLTRPRICTEHAEYSAEDCVTVELHSVIVQPFFAVLYVEVCVFLGCLMSIATC